MRLATGLLAAFSIVIGFATAAAAQVSAGHRIALVVGNAGYAEQPLSNPINDARAMADSLKQRGFEVTLRENTSKIVLERAILDFGEKLQQGATGLFYYAGHAMEVNGRNFLIPVDAQLRTEQRARIEAVEVDLILEQMQAARSSTNLVILDACRNNPFEKRFRSAGGGGLALIKEAPKGTLIAYATSPGKVAADGDGKHSLYTEELLKAMQLPGAKVEEVFKTVRVAVSQRSNDTQTPWEASSLTGDFYFTPPAPPKPEPVAAPPAPPPPAGPNRAAMEVTFWDSVKGSTNPAELQAYLEQFPDGTFAALAKARIAALTAPKPEPAPAPPPAQSGPSRAAMDAAFWDSVKGSSNPAELQAYLAQFPDGTFAALARARIAALTAPPPAAPAPQVRAAAPTPPSGPPQQMAALPPASAPLADSPFDGTYTTQLRSMRGNNTAVLTIKDLKITGRVDEYQGGSGTGRCTIAGQIESSGAIREMALNCVIGANPIAGSRFTGRFAPDPATGRMTGQTRRDAPGQEQHGSSNTWTQGGPASEATAQTGAPAQMAALPPATGPLTAASFDGTYTARVRLGNVAEETATVVIRNLSISGRAGSECSFGGALEPDGTIRNFQALCVGGGRPPGAIRYTGTFAPDSQGRMAAVTTVQAPGVGVHGDRVVWTLRP